MSVLHEFKREERLPSYFVNRIQDFLSAAHTDLRVTLKSPTEVEVVPVEPYGIAAIDLEGRWRFRTTAVSRVHPGGAAGTYIVWAVGTDQNVTESPKPFTDETDYDFDLRITSGADPSGAGVEVFEKVAELDWNGAAITTLRQVYNAVTGPMIADGALGTGTDIEWKREANGSWVPSVKAKAITTAKIADALKPSAGAGAGTESLRALGTTGSTAAAGNDARLSDERIPTANSVTEPKIADGAVSSRKINPTLGFASSLEKTTFNTNAANPLKGLKAEIEVPVKSKILVVGVMHHLLNVGSTSEIPIIETYLQVDGASIIARARSGFAVQRYEVSVPMIGEIEVAAGAHTLQACGSMVTAPGAGSAVVSGASYFYYQIFAA
jgi:hypothetical protein